MARESENTLCSRCRSTVERKEEGVNAIDNPIDNKNPKVHKILMVVQ